MHPEDRTPQRRSPPIDSDIVVARAGAGRRGRPRVNIASRLHAMQVRRIIVLAERFQELCALRSDPMCLIDLLRSLIACSREAFVGEPRAAGGASRRRGPSADQLSCLEDLELLMQGLIHGAPGVSRGLAHAMDSLLIQCVVFEAASADAAEATPAVRG